MNINFRFEGLDGLIKKLKGSPNLILDAVERAMDDTFFNEMLRTAKENAQFKILRRQQGTGTGRLAQAIFAQVIRQRVSVLGSLNVDLSEIVYAAAQEFGATIVPKNKKALTIPFPGVLGSAREYQNTFIAKGIIFQKIGKKQIKPLFVLKKKVVLPQRAYMRPAIEEHIPLLRQRLKQELEALNI